ncbi:MAG: response regulator [Gammaproteobacteria bacterium]|jgi:RNA polymerase sigma factor (sigma-70 family)
MSEQTVFIIDDDSTVRDSIKELFESVGLKTNIFTSSLDFLEQYNSELTGCIVSDIRMAGLSGLALQKELNDMGSDIPIVFITAYSDVSVISEAFRDGAFDVIGKPYQEQQLLDTINAALQVEKESRKANSEKEDFKKKAESLTSREQEVLSLVADGLTNKVIARQLDISPRTVEVHRQRALMKIGTRSVNEIKKYLSG